MFSGTRPGGWLGSFGWGVGVVGYALSAIAAGIDIPAIARVTAAQAQTRRNARIPHPP
ncbi:hypothetical protein GCM10027597_22410 [Saccharopolyspora tripterygii]